MKSLYSSTYLLHVVYIISTAFFLKQKLKIDSRAQIRVHWTTTMSRKPYASIFYIIRIHQTKDVMVCVSAVSASKSISVFVQSTIVKHVL